MTNIRKFDNALLFLQEKAKAMGYGIDADERYIGVCGIVTELDMGWMEETEAGDKLIWHKIGALAKCICPKEYQLFEEIFQKP